MSDIEAAARAWVASEVDAYPGVSMDDRIASWMRGGVHPDDVGRFLVDAYSSGYVAALAHAKQRGEGEDMDAIANAHGHGQESAMRDAAAWLANHGMPNLGAALLKEYGCATTPPATGEDVRGEDREAIEAARSHCGCGAAEGEAHRRGCVGMSA
jgi:hypothetical protein